MTPSKPEAQRWQFKARFRRHAFGWKSQPAITRIKQAVAEIRKVAKQDPMLAAEGAVLFLERISPALEQVDGSSGSIGNAVNGAIDALASIVALAPADAKTRDAWLERLYEAHQADQIPYIERLSDCWGELCASKEVASAWGDRLLDATRRALLPSRGERVFFHGTSACLSALYRAERFDELVELLRCDTIWPYQRWAVKAMAALGRTSEALAYAESCHATSLDDVAAVCEEILLAAGRVDEAYARYGVRANGRGTYLATFRAVAARYPHKPPSEILARLVAATPGDEGKWFAAAKELGLRAEALALASRAPCDPRTLTRAARDYAEEDPAFALGAGLLALRWIAEGHGYEITGADVFEAYQHTLAAAERRGDAAGAKERIRELVASGGVGASFVGRMLRSELSW